MLYDRKLNLLNLRGIQQTRKIVQMKMYEEGGIRPPGQIGLISYFIRIFDVCLKLDTKRYLMSITHSITLVVRSLMILVVACNLRLTQIFNSMLSWPWGSHSHFAPWGITSSNIL